MSEKPISPLRRRMIEDMTVRNFVEKTRNDYIRHVRSFTAFLGRSPDTAVAEDLRRFQLHQTQTGVRPPSINGSVAALSAAYAAGLRVSEVVALKVSDIDSERLLLRIEQGKGRKDRFAMLSPKLLELLRDWYRIARPAVGCSPAVIRCCR